VGVVSVGTLSRYHQRDGWMELRMIFFSLAIVLAKRMVREGIGGLSASCTTHDGYQEYQGMKEGT
jgi:hypothetical protein